MKYYKDEKNQVYAYEADGSQDAYIKPDLIAITDVEAEELRKPAQKTIEEQTEDVRIALQAAIDAKAIALGFKSGGNGLMLYAGKDNPYRSIADVFFLWESSVWAEADAYKEEVIAGTKPMLSPSEAVALMPEYPA